MNPSSGLQRLGPGFMIYCINRFFHFLMLYLNHFRYEPEQRVTKTGSRVHDLLYQPVLSVSYVILEPF